MLVIWGFYGKHWFSLSEHFLAQCLSFAALFGMGNKNAVGERGDMGIALDRKIGCGAANAVGEKGQNQQAPFGQRFLPVFRNPCV